MATHTPWGAKAWREPFTKSGREEKARELNAYAVEHKTGWTYEARVYVETERGVDIGSIERKTEEATAS